MLWRWPCDYKHTDNWIIIRFCWFLYLQPDFHKRLPRPVVHPNMRPNTSTDIPLSSEVDKLTVDASTLTQRVSIPGAKTQDPWWRRALKSFNNIIKGLKLPCFRLLAFLMDSTRNELLKPLLNSWPSEHHNLKQCLPKLSWRNSITTYVVTKAVYS